jgi:hypothetical protein
MIASAPLFQPSSVSGSAEAQSGALPWPFFQRPLLFQSLPPTLTLTFGPQIPSVPDAATGGYVVAPVTATWSDGSLFTGTINFSQSYADDSGIALSRMQSRQRRSLSAGWGLA